MIVAVALPAVAAEHSPFLDLGGLPEGDLAAAAARVRQAIDAAEGLESLGGGPYAGPDLLREGSAKRDGRSGFLLLFEDAALSEALLAASPRYYLGALQRVGLYVAADGGLRVTCLDAETHLRVIANDLADDAAYAGLVAEGAAARGRIVSALAVEFGFDGKTRPVGPAREAKRIREGKKDMFMMVGPLTYYREESQFPLLHAEPLGDDPAAQLRALADRAAESLAAFSADAKDLDYRWSADPVADTRWVQALRMEAPGRAILLGLTRPRTEALAAQIVGLSRDSKADRSPGLDHLCAFPVEVLICVNGDRVEMRTAREMYRMDLFFWDAGKAAFMKYAQMPAMLDRSLKKALLGE